MSEGVGRTPRLVVEPPGRVERFLERLAGRVIRAGAERAMKRQDYHEVNHWFAALHAWNTGRGHDPHCQMTTMFDAERFHHPYQAPRLPSERDRP